MTDRRRRPGAPDVRTAVLDLGSTTFQLLVADADPEGGLTPILRDRVVLNLGLVLANHGRIPQPEAQRAADTARRLRDVAVRAGADRFVVLATSALRDSHNRGELTVLLEEAVGLPVQFIDGREEARLTLLGVTASVAVDGGPTLLLDLGGGSLEVALTDDTGLRWGRSVPVGAGRLTGMLAGSDPPTREERKAVQAAVKEAVSPFVADIRDFSPARCIASGGTAGALARLLAARRWAIPPASLNQYSFPVADLRALTRRLDSMTLKQRLQLPGIDERRADLLPVGGWVLTTAAATLDVEELVHSEWGFREGAVLDALGIRQDTAPSFTDLRRRSVDRLVRMWGEDPRYLDLVAAVAETLFDGTRELHGLGVREREWLGHAARLHTIGSRISPARLHKHGAYLVEHGGLRGFSPEEIAILASVVRFQRGKDPRPVYAPYSGLPAGIKRTCVVLVGIFRIAHAIARGPEDEGLVVTTKLREKGPRIRVAGSSNPEAVLVEAAEASGLLERTLEAAIAVETTVSGTS
ncbi:MAG: hypothetical protein A2Z12_10255 [Actinobacteria bacterium RBG_16_68_21]|nr:MAG: hypothetical protein A2Z12_10255 [Actinobacteria bacterium RBG_16_68_21]